MRPNEDGIDCMMTRLLYSWDSSRLALGDIYVDVHGVTDGPMD